jgi:hypothetical protein
MLAPVIEPWYKSRVEHGVLDSSLSSVPTQHQLKTTSSGHEGELNISYVQFIRLLIVIQVLAILYKGGNAAKEEPRLLGTVENEVSND